MKAMEFILLGTVYAGISGASEFVFKHPLNTFAVSLGMIIAGVIFLIFETIVTK